MLIYITSCECYVCQVQLPLAVAAAAGASSSVRALIAADISPTLTDYHKNNIIHSLIAFLFHHPQCTESVLEQYELIMGSCDLDTQRIMLLQENKLGLRPLEFAAQNCQAGMIHAIMSTRDVYMAKMEQSGLLCSRYYDITDYESTELSGRQQHSLVTLLTLLHHRQGVENIQCMKHDWLHSWQMAKITSNIPLPIIWFLLRVCFIAGYLVFYADTSDLHQQYANSTNCEPQRLFTLSKNSKLVLSVYLIIWASASLIIYCIEFVRYLYLMWSKSVLLYNLAGYKLYGTQVLLYRLTAVSLDIIVITNVSFFFTGSSDYEDWVFDFITMSSPLMLSMNVLYFIQMLPSLGIFVISLYNLMGTLCHFVIVYSLLAVPYLFLLQNFINSNTQQGCIDGFGTFLESAYSVFLIMLNMLNLREYQINHAGVLYYSHVMFTVIVSITFLNFFIAMICNSITVIAERADDTLMLQRLTVIYMLEYRWRWLLKPYYKYMNSKVFHYENQRIYVVERDVVKT